MVTGSEPAFVEDVVRPLREVLTVALFAAVAVRLAQRIRGATQLTRRTLAPVLGRGVLPLRGVRGGLVGRRARARLAVVEVVGLAARARGAR